MRPIRKLQHRHCGTQRKNFLYTIKRPGINKTWKVTDWHFFPWHVREHFILVAMYLGCIFRKRAWPVSWPQLQMTLSASSFLIALFKLLFRISDFQTIARLSGRQMIVSTARSRATTNRPSQLSATDRTYMSIHAWDRMRLHSGVECHELLLLSTPISATLPLAMKLLYSSLMNRMSSKSESNETTV